MPLRWTLDENGVPVISLEKVYIRESTSKTRKQSDTSSVLRESKLKESSRKSKASSSSTNRTIKAKANAERVRTPGPKKLKARNLSQTQLLSRKPMVMCSLCQQNLREDNWNKHVRKVHAAKSRSQTVARQTERSKVSNIGGLNGGNERHKYLNRTSKTNDVNSEQRRAIRGFFEELAYGDKYLGQVRRESDGRFGSIPLYDDYSEDSYPD